MAYVGSRRATSGLGCGQFGGRQRVINGLHKGQHPTEVLTRLSGGKQCELLL